MIFIVNPLFSQEDWANLNRFKMDNDSINQLINNGDRIVFMGNSITEGWIKHHPDYFRNSDYINRGISGQTTAQMLLRFRQDVINLHPKAVVILAGTNDIAQNKGAVTQEMIQDNISAMAYLAKVNGITVILCSVLPASDYPWRMGLHPDKKIPALNKWIMKYALDNDCYYVDFFSAMTNGANGMDKEISEDGVHPNDTGYSIMEPLLEVVIQDIFN